MRDEFAGELSGGQRKLLEMARALMAKPRLLMLDEPMAGVNPALAQTIIGHVQQLREDGLTVVFVEHDMDVVVRGHLRTNTRARSEKEISHINFSFQIIVRIHFPFLILQ
jgi:ABC-type branched-subunit amino acid transport system ATPase component